MKPSLKKVMHWVLASNYYGFHMIDNIRFSESQNILEEEIIKYFKHNKKKTTTWKGKGE